MFGSPNAGNQQAAGAGSHGGWGSLASSSGAGSNELQRSQYQTGYLMSSLQNQQTQNQPSSCSEDPPLLSTKSHGHSHISPRHHTRAFGHSSEFGTDNLFQRSTNRMDMNDEDAPPTTSLHDAPAWTPSSSNAPRFKNSSSFGTSTGTNTATPIRSSSAPFKPNTPHTPTTEDKPKPHFLTIFGYPSPSAFSTLSQSFTSLANGDIAPPENDENGGNWFTIGYYKLTDARRALARDGEVVRDSEGGGRYMIGVRWRDALGGNGRLASEGMDLGGSKALVRAGAGVNSGPFGNGSPLQPASTAFRRPEPPKASTPAGASADQGVAGISPSKSNGTWIGSVGDMIFGW